MLYFVTTTYPNGATKTLYAGNSYSQAAHIMSIWADDNPTLKTI